MYACMYTSVCVYNALSEFPLEVTWCHIQVRVEMYAANTLVAYAEFDGVESDHTSWFSQDRLHNSSWTEELAEYTRKHPLVVSLDGL